MRITSWIAVCGLVLFALCRSEQHGGQGRGPASSSHGSCKIERPLYYNSKGTFEIGIHLGTCPHEVRTELHSTQPSSIINKNSMNYCCSDSAYVVREEAAADVNNEFLVNSIVTGVEVGDYINWNDCFGTVATSNLPKYVNYRDHQVQSNILGFKSNLFGETSNFFTSIIDSKMLANPTLCLAIVKERNCVNYAQPIGSMVLGDEPSNVIISRFYGKFELAPADSQWEVNVVGLWAEGQKVVSTTVVEPAALDTSTPFIAIPESRYISLLQYLDQSYGIKCQSQRTTGFNGLQLCMLSPPVAKRLPQFYLEIGSTQSLSSGSGINFTLNDAVVPLQDGLALAFAKNNDALWRIGTNFFLNRVVCYQPRFEEQPGYVYIGETN